MVYGIHCWTGKLQACKHVQKIKQRPEMMHCGGYPVKMNSWHMLTGLCRETVQEWAPAGACLQTKECTVFLKTTQSLRKCCYNLWWLRRSAFGLFSSEDCLVWDSLQKVALVCPCLMTSSGAMQDPPCSSGYANTSHAKTGWWVLLDAGNGWTHALWLWRP